MTTGSVQTILICVPSTFSQAPCPSGTALTTTQAYVIDPTQAATIDAQNAPFDYVQAGAIWSLGFTFVVGLYVVSKSAGAIINLIRK